MDSLVQIASGVAFVAFIAGLLCTVDSGSVRNVKILLGVLTLLICTGFAAGLVFSRGLLILFLFHLITLICVLSVFIIVGAACGGAIYLYRHQKPPGKSLDKAELGEYLPAAEFATLEGISEERALPRIKSGYYKGGLHQGAWYIHKSELSENKP